jgi:hypothetical protein
MQKESERTMSEQLRMSYIEQINTAKTMGGLMLIASCLYGHYHIAYKMGNQAKMNVINELLARIDYRLNNMHIVIVNCAWL